MRHFHMTNYQNSMRLMRLNREGKAKVTGPVKAGETLQWVRTFGDKVIYIGLVLRQGVRL